VPLLLMELAAGEVFCGLTAAPRSHHSWAVSQTQGGPGVTEMTSLVVAATTSRILVIDMRRPSGPLVSAPHQLSPGLQPHLLALLPLDEGQGSQAEGSQSGQEAGDGLPNPEEGLLLLWSDGVTGVVRCLELRLHPCDLQLVLTHSSTASGSRQGKTQLMVRRVSSGQVPGLGAGPGWGPVCWGHAQAVGLPQFAGPASQASWQAE
jgi:hypothetical protein